MESGIVSKTIVIIINLWSYVVHDYLIDAFKNILKHSVHFYDFFTLFRFLWFLDITFFSFSPQPSTTD